MFGGGSTEEPHKHAKQGRNRELGHDKEQSLAKGKHPGMGDRPDLHGDTGEGIALYAPSPAITKAIFSVGPAAHLGAVQPELGWRAMAEGGQGFQGGWRRLARGQLLM